MTLKRGRNVVDDIGLVDVKLEDEKKAKTAKREQDALMIDLTCDDSDGGETTSSGAPPPAALRGLSAPRRSGEYSMSGGALTNSSIKVAPPPASTPSRRLSTAATPRQRDRSRRASSSFLASQAETPGSNSRSTATAPRRSAAVSVATPGESTGSIFAPSSEEVSTTIPPSTATDVVPPGVFFQNVGDLLKAFDRASARNMRASHELNYNKVLLSAIMQLFYKFFDRTCRLLPDLKRNKWADVAVDANGKRTRGFEKFGSSDGNVCAMKWFAHLRDFVEKHMPSDVVFRRSSLNSAAVKEAGIAVAAKAAEAWEEREREAGGDMLSRLPDTGPA